MRIFFAGASGVIGQRLIPRLVQAGHVVGGLTRSPGKTALLSHLGAEPVQPERHELEQIELGQESFPKFQLTNAAARRLDSCK